MRTRKSLAALLALISLTALGAFVPARAASVEPVDLLIKLLIDKGIVTEEEAAGVRADVAVLKQEEEAKKKASPVTGKQPIKLSGYIQNRFTASQARGTKDTFEVRRARIALSGQPTPELDYKLQLDVSGSRKGTESVDFAKQKTKSALFGKPVLLDAVVGYQLPGQLKISFGQQKLPFSQENLIASTQLETINRAQVVERLVPGRDIGAQGRDIGVYLGGTAPVARWGRFLDYSAAVVNGSGINTGDDNDRKDEVIRAVLRPAKEGLSLGASYYNGAAGSPQTVKIRTGVEAAYLKAPWLAKGEWVRGRDGSVHKQGWYLLLGRSLGEDWQGILKFDTFDPDEDRSADQTSVVTLGLNWFLSKDRLTRLQFNLEHKTENPSVNNDQFLAQFQAGF